MLTGRSENAQVLRAVLFDLNTTLLLEDQATDRTFREAAAVAQALGHRP